MPSPTRPRRYDVCCVRARAHRPGAAAVDRGGRTPISRVGTWWVPLGPVSTAIAETTQAPAAKSATLYQLSASPPISAPAMVGVKPASAKPNWVPIAMPDSRTLVGKYSAYVAGQTALGIE